ncbi:hypothetical protein GU261_04960 [Vibrio cholerae]|uniref:hypothetical protein n=1 Tax=Vibrio cholerae TaxID=666 RepID=UPI00155F0188|nr:hypothetical protein [Vibrio cholerae]EGR1057239.1 hypothetical protein [Vibrio cholerae]NOE59505.1 hypothetical protein [Vibrio cholerae]
MLHSNELDFSTILSDYHSVDEQEKRWKETCAALTLIKHTLHCDSATTLSNLERHIQSVANGIRASLEQN